MTSLLEYLKNLSETDPMIASILEEYQEIEAFYNGSMEATGLLIREQLPGDSSTAKVTLSFRMSPSTADGRLIVRN